MLELSQINDLKQKASKLEKKDIDLVITDLDNTIFSTIESRKLNLLGGRRGNEGNKYMIEHYGVDRFIKKMYVEKKYPTIITSKLRENHDLILTAGVEEIQTKKLQALGLDNIKYRVVDKAEDKILSTIDYIINELKFIPNKILLFEDTTKYFIENKKLIEEILQTKLVINEVIMNGNEKEPEIKKVA